MNLLTEIISKNYVLYAMAGVFGLGIISRFFLNVIYRGLQKGVLSLPATRSKLVKQIKLKYESCDKLDMQISNTEAFVRKNLNEYKVFGISLRAMEKILGQAMFFGVLIGVTTAVFVAIAKLPERMAIVHIAATVLGTALLFNYDKLSDIDYKRQAIEMGLVDFLENHLQIHLLAPERGEAAFAESCGITDNTEAANNYSEETGIVGQTGSRKGFVEADGSKQTEEGKIINFATNNKRNEEFVASADLQTDENNKAGEKIDDNMIIEEVLREFFG